MEEKIKWDWYDMTPQYVYVGRNVNETAYFTMQNFFANVMHMNANSNRIEGSTSADDAFINSVTVCSMAAHSFL